MLCSKFISFLPSKSFTSFNLISAFSTMASDTIYHFTVKDSNEQDVSLSKYQGKVVLIVNVASQCGYTDKHYLQLKELLEKYKPLGLEIAAFPCNQFGSQEPQCAIDVQQKIKEKYQFEPDFYKKVDVNGSNADPLYKFLKKEKAGFVFDAIKWNFTKFLVNRSGHVIKRVAATSDPNSMIPDIEKALAEQE